MRPEDARVEEIFGDALEIESAEERVAYLTRACGEDAALREVVESLLRAHARGGDILEKPAMETNGPSWSLEAPGTLIGPYKLLEPIGEGGFAVVYRAEQLEPVRREVALKILKAGVDTREVVARFQAERQALALMDHPNVAQVYDAGATEQGRPYFAMELVSGSPITAYCDRHELDPTQRLELFIQVCRGVQHAHQKGIIHRDLKPTNVLVSRQDGHPVPKVIDFGVAKALSQPLTEMTLFTRYGVLIGTPPYISPEQVGAGREDIDTRSDIYGLGALLYELLTGSPPFDPERLRQAGFQEILRILREEEPPKPSTQLTRLGDRLGEVARHRQVAPATLTKVVHGDLDWIVMKALEKERERRYATPNELARDVERHLHHEAVHAAAPGATYRLGKFVRRHRYTVATVSLVTLSLVVGLIASTIGFMRADWQRKRAEQERTRAVTAERRAQANEREARLEAVRSAEVARFMKDMLRGVGPSVALGRDTTMLREILDQTVQRLDTDLADQPEVEADLRETLGAVYRDLGEYAEAEAMLREALSLRRGLHGDDHVAVASVLVNLGVVLHIQRRVAEAEASHREALAIQRKHLGDENTQTAATLNHLGSLLRFRRNSSEGEVLIRKALGIRRRLLPSDHPDIVDSLEDLGLVLLSQGKRGEAEPIVREGVVLARQLSPRNPIAEAALLKLLGNVLAVLGEYTEAETNLLEALEIQKRLLGDHRGTAQTLNQLGQLALSRGKLTEAEQTFGEQVAMLKRTQVNDSDVVGPLTELADVLRAQGKLEEMEEVCRELVELGDPWSLNELAWVLATACDPNQRHGPWAVNLAERAVALTVRTDAMYLDTLAAAYAEVGQFDKAVATEKEAIKLVPEGEEHQFYVQCLSLYEASIPYRDPGALAARVSGLLQEGKFAEAEPGARECLRLREMLMPDDWRTFNAMSMLGGALLGQQKYTEAEPLLVSAYDGMIERQDEIPAVGRPRLKETLQRLVQLYENTGRPHQATVWKQKLDSFEQSQVE